MEKYILSIILFNSPVDKLVDDDNVSWLNLLPERTACRGNQQMSTALFSHRPDVGLVVHIGWHYSVLSPMPEDGKTTTKSAFKMLIVSTDFQTNACKTCQRSPFLVNARHFH